jgi:hypothetical protein
MTHWFRVTYQESPFCCDLPARRGFGSAGAFQRCRQPFGPPQRPTTGTAMTRQTDTRVAVREGLETTALILPRILVLLRWYTDTGESRLPA